MRNAAPVAEITRDANESAPAAKGNRFPFVSGCSFRSKLLRLFVRAPSVCFHFTLFYRFVHPKAGAFAEKADIFHD